MSIVDRARNIIVSPRQEWEVIARENPSVAELYTGYIMPLAAIGPIATIIGQSLFGVSLGSAIVQAVVGYVLTLGGAYVLALIIDALAPSFGGEKNFIRALQVTAYGSTASWLSGIFNIVPALAILGILGLYSLYLFYLGLPILMKAPQDRAVMYTVAVIVAAVVVFIVVGVVTGIVIGVLIGALFAATAI